MLRRRNSHCASLLGKPENMIMNPGFRTTWPIKLAAITAVSVALWLDSDTSKARENGASVPQLVSWSGEINLRLRAKAPKHGFIDSRAQLKELWSAWRPGEEVPRVNFFQAVVLVAANSDPNSIGMEASLGPDGNLTINHISTLVGHENPTTFKYLISVISRIDVKTIRGQPLKD